jgi:hypothetical protein
MVMVLAVLTAALGWCPARRGVRTVALRRGR